MLRHADKSMNAVYVGREYLLKEIQKKLDDKAVENNKALADFRMK